MFETSNLVRGMQCEELPCGSNGKESACNVGDLDLIPGFGRSPGEGNGNPLQYSCLDNSMNRGAWRPWDLKELDTTEQLTYIYAVWGCYCPWIWDTIHLTMTRDTYLTATICLPILHIKWGNPSIKCNKFFLTRSKHRPFLKRLCWNINSTYLRWPPLKWI